MEPSRLWNRRYVQLLAIEACLQMGGFLTRSINANYAIDLGASMTVAGFIAGIMATAALLFRPFSGAISDRLSKRTLLIFSCGLFTAGAFGCAAFRNLWLLGACLCLQGFAFAFKSAIIVSMVPLTVPKKYIGTGVGWLGLAYTLAIALGPAIGSQIGLAVGYPMTYVASGLFLIASFALALTFRAPIGKSEKAADPASASSEAPEGASAAGAETCDGGDSAADGAVLHAAEEVEMDEAAFESAGCPYGASEREAVSKRYSGKGLRSRLSAVLYLPVIPLSIVGGLIMISTGIASSFVLLTGEMAGIETASLYFVFYSVTNLGARPLAGRLSDAFGVKFVAPPMMLIAMAGMLSLAFLPSTFGVILSGLCMGLGQSSAYAAIQAESVRNVPVDQLGRSANTYFIGPDLAMGLGPVAGGAVLGAWGPASMYVFCAMSLAFALALFLHLYNGKRIRRR